MKKHLAKGQVWELVTTDEVIILMLLERREVNEHRIVWDTLVLHDTLYPNTVGTVTSWQESDLLSGPLNDEGEFVRLS